ncbi:MAG: Gldg family protein [Chloroflexi bacterium]|nr:Gldg family protein [Chloroflexota bacterium]
MKTILSITRKELSAYFGSAMALIFIGAFLVASLFTFFWVEAFFSSGVAELRPLFRWMPILLIFLVAALTMRQWSEEQRSGTLELLLTLPAQTIKLVLGKFLAVMALVAIALGLTLPLAITVGLLGNLDWGPVVGGYLAALLLAGAYAAIGLFASSRTDNQVVALIVTAFIGGLFYLVGSSGVTDFAGANIAELLRAIGTGSRFESIERGVIDLRDLIYYLSLTALFLFLNTWSLDRKRWSSGLRTQDYRRNMNVTGALVALNLLALNIWVAPLQGLRADLTEQQEFSLSQTTWDLLNSLQEPLLIRAYISEKTHPLLAPLAPQVRDMLREYQIAGNGKVNAEVIDPISDPEAENEAARTYGIQSTPLQVSGRYEASLINVYFDILVRYGDQNTVLNFQDMIEVNSQRDGTVDVRLRNLEYDLTSAIKKVSSGFQSIDALFASYKDPVKLLIIATPDTLPQAFQDAPATMEKVAKELQQKSNGKFEYQVVNPDDPQSTLTRTVLREQYQLQSTPVSLFSDQTYYLNLLLISGGQAQALYPEGDYSETAVRTALESALKRSSTGFIKVVGLWTPPAMTDQYGQSAQTSMQMINRQLSRDYTVRTVDLATGAVPSDIDMLLVIGPRDMSDKERYAIDQYLMQGGAVVIAGGNYYLSPLSYDTALLGQVSNGLNDMLAHYGVNIGTGLVMDPQNEPFPTQVQRQVQGYTVQEVQAVDYPFFVDVRTDGMDRSNAIVSSLPAVTMNWVSPVELDPAKNANRKTSVLLHSTSQAWLRTDTDIQPNFQAYPDLGFAVGDERKSYPLAVAVQGQFESYFKGKPSPLTQQEPAATAAAPEAATATPAPVRPSSALEQSPDTARLVVIGSSDFLNDIVLQLSSRLSQDRYLNNLQLAQNVVDWSVADLDLLTIRSRGTVSRVLNPLTESQRTTWEVANYVIALLALIAIGAIWRLRQRNETPMELVEVKA